MLHSSPSQQKMWTDGVQRLVGRDLHHNPAFTPHAISILVITGQAIIETFVLAIRPAVAFILVTAILDPAQTGFYAQRSFSRMNIAENLIYLFLDVWLPWFSEAVLLLCIAIVFPRHRLALLLVLPFTVKAGRVAINSLFCMTYTMLFVAGAEIGTPDSLGIVAPWPDAAAGYDRFKLRVISLSVENRSTPQSTLREVWH
ncbi:hypothetical protein B0H19DRAFT_1064402 [Mycena capillaripes]|nr:hypothetical protein B0H19DRAFT_1064402 [Mycena capillaripes]